MTLTVALDRRDLGPIAVPIEVSDPATWSRAEAREFVFTLQRLLGGGGISAIRLRYSGLMIAVELSGVGGRLTTPPLALPEPAERFVLGAVFELPPTSAR